MWAVAFWASGVWAEAVWTGVDNGNVSRRAMLNAIFSRRRRR